ncbi:MAG TPA: CoB--CoM heterodisulfide reductase iron-sulfur subunit B family protein [Desulfobacteria bacterium]|nr:CoB--CoM heterodisulfide reductase iron-sulfur subunit B family protein [Desulfobacteria bacterium]
MKVAYYPGCSLSGSAQELDISIKAISGPLGLELVEVPDWNCCGASSAHSTGHFLSFALPARNVIKAEGAGCEEFTAPCPACYVRSFLAQKQLNEDEHMKQHLENALGQKFGPSNIKIKNVIEIFMDKVSSEHIKKPLNGLKVVNYYGCALVKPPKTFGFFDDPENPQSMDKIMDLLGAKSIQWPYKTECCSASLCFTNQDATWKACRDILQVAEASDAQAVVVACTLCQNNLDMRQAQVNKKYGTRFNLPVIYFTQLIGLAMGIPGHKLGLDKHFIDPKPLLKSLNLY